MGYEHLTPYQKMILPPLIFLEEHYGRGLNWMGYPEFEAGFWLMDKKFAAAKLEDLMILESQKLIELGIHPDNHHAFVRLLDSAHLAVHEKFGLPIHLYVLNAAYVAARGGKNDGAMFYREIAERYAQLGDEFEPQWQRLVKDKCIEESLDLTPHGRFARITRIGIAMVEREPSKDASQTPAVNYSISNSPGAILQHAQHSNASVNQSGVSGFDLKGIIDQIRSLPGLDANQRQEIEETVDELCNAAKSPTPKPSKIKSCASYLSQLIPVGKATVGIVNQISALCKSAGIAEEDIIKLFHHHH